MAGYPTRPHIGCLVHTSVACYVRRTRIAGTGARANGDRVNAADVREAGIGSGCGPKSPIGRIGRGNNSRVIHNGVNHIRVRGRFVNSRHFPTAWHRGGSRGGTNACPRQRVPRVGATVDVLKSDDYTPPIARCHEERRVACRPLAAVASFGRRDISPVAVKHSNHCMPIRRAAERPPPYCFGSSTYCTHC